MHKQFGAINRWALTELTHQGSSLPIDPADILRNMGKTDEEIARLTAEAEHMWFVEHRMA